MEVKPGYKQTEAGIIPEDWHAERLADIGRFSKGLGIKKDESLSGTIPCIRYGEIYTHHNYIIKRFNSFISSDVAKTSQKLNIGDILFAGSGETKEEIGKAVAFTQQVEAYAGGDIVILTPKSTNSTYLGYALNSPAVIRQKASKGQGDAVVHISSHSLGEVALPIPSQSEQSAIAMALSDMDALLESLNSLIAKKRVIKQAAMQQIFTKNPKKSETFGEWKSIKIGELGMTYGGIFGKSKADFNTGQSKYIPFTNIINNTKIDIKDLESVNITPEEKQNKVKRGDLLFNGSSETADEIAMCSFMPEEVNDLYLNSFCFGFRIKDEEAVDGLFVAYYMRSPTGRNLIKSLAQGSTRHNLSKKSLLETALRLPKKEIQIAISSILNEMDSEITSLEKIYKKTSFLKDAMMQELLIGRTRLI